MSNIFPSAWSQRRRPAPPERFQHPARVIASGFGAVVLAGTLLLLLPASSRTGERVDVVDALFTSTSAVCLTGWRSSTPARTGRRSGRS